MTRVLTNHGAIKVGRTFTARQRLNLLELADLHFDTLYKRDADG